MRAKRFFYVSLGILAIATAYHLGAGTAGAQGGAALWCANTNDTAAGVLVGRTITCVRWGPTGGPISSPPVPGSSSIVAIDAQFDAGGPLYATAVLADGSVYILRPDTAPSWTMVDANLFGGPTPAIQSSWGALKAKSR